MDLSSGLASIEASKAGGSGVHIHIEDSVLNALLEKVPWAQVFESFNNKLSRTEETKHIQEHIYKLAKEDDVYDHSQWNDWNLDKQSFNHFADHNNQMASSQNLQQLPSLSKPQRRRITTLPQKQWRNPNQDWCQRLTYAQWYRWCLPKSRPSRPRPGPRHR